MSNSSLATVHIPSPNYTVVANKINDTITIHHMAGDMTIESCGNMFASKTRAACSNYGIGSDGRIALYCDEMHRAWTSGSYANDSRAVTIEVANNSGDPDWTVSDEAFGSLIDLCVDICKRNGIKSLSYTGGTSGNLTLHKWFQPTLCPGPYLEGKMPEIANLVNARLEEKPLYRVQIGAFHDIENARAMMADIESKGYQAFITTV